MEGYRSGTTACRIKSARWYAVWKRENAAPMMALVLIGLVVRVDYNNRWPGQQQLRV